MNLKRQSTYEYREGEDYNGPTRLVYTLEYNEQGLLSKEHQYDTQGNKVLTNHYLYDDKGLLVRENVYAEWSTLKNFNLYSYDDQKRLLRIERHFGEPNFELEQFVYKENQMVHEILDIEHNLMKKFIRRFGSQKELLELLVFNEANRVEERFLHHYDEANKLAEIIKFKGLDIQQERLAFFYNEIGERICSKRYNEENKLMSRETFEYQNALLVHSITDDYHRRVPHQAFHYFYDADKRLVEQHHGDTDGHIFERKRFKYNNHNDVSKEILESMYMAEPLIREHKLEYFSANLNVA